MIIRPISLKVAQDYVRQHHRHNRPPVGHKFSVGLYVDGCRLIGVAVAGRPIARALDNGLTLEVTRVCTDGTKNASSKLYSAITRAAKAMGYIKCITYTQLKEGGVSLRASGWRAVAVLPQRKGWDTASRHRENIEKENMIERIRWEVVLNEAGATDG